MTRKLLLMGGKRPQLRRGNSRSWTKRKGVEFLSVLADTCNVTEACRASKLTISVAYRRRNIDAAFRASWVEALGVAYSKLELVLLERAFNGVEKVYKRRDGSQETMREYAGLGYLASSGGLIAGGNVSARGTQHDFGPVPGAGLSSAG